MIIMKEIEEKLKQLLKDLKEQQRNEKYSGKNYFNTDLMAVRVNEIYKMVKHIK